MRMTIETALDLPMQGFDLKHVLTAFAEVTEFRALGSQSYSMARALTSALVGMGFEELSQVYKAQET
jgi:hypothetical protein